jgi:hypothetical protein
VNGRSWNNGKLVVRWGASEIIDFECSNDHGLGLAWRMLVDYGANLLRS